MKYLSFKLDGKEFTNTLVSDRTVYFLTYQENRRLRDSKSKDILDEAAQLDKDQIIKFDVVKGKKEVIIFNLLDKETKNLRFKSLSQFKQFIAAFPSLRKAKSPSVKKINKFNTIALLLISFAFIWTGTRTNSSDISAKDMQEGKLQKAMKALEWLNNLLGQSAMLAIGIILSLLLVYLIGQPQIQKLKNSKVSYLKVR